MTRRYLDPADEATADRLPRLRWILAEAERLMEARAARGGPYLVVIREMEDALGLPRKYWRMELGEAGPRRRLPGETTAGRCYDADALVPLRAEIAAAEARLLGAPRERALPVAGAMTGPELRACLRALGWSQAQATTALLGSDDATGRVGRWVRGETPVPEWVAAHLRGFLGLGGRDPWPSAVQEHAVELGALTPARLPGTLPAAGEEPGDL